MYIRFGHEIEIQCHAPIQAFTLMEAHPRTSGLLSEKRTQIPLNKVRDINGNDLSRFHLPEGPTIFHYDAVVLDDGIPERRLANEVQDDVTALPAEVLPYLFPSRFCQSDLIAVETWQRFGHLNQGADRVRAIFDFVHMHLTFGYEHADAQRDAMASMHDPRGVCRDFAHLAVAMCRSMNIPARYCNGYLGDIGVPYNPSPMDFNAWSEVWLQGSWHVLDARHNTPRVGRITIARGRDAADIPMINSFGPHVLQRFNVWTYEHDSAELT